MKKVVSIKILSLFAMFFISTASFAVQDEPSQPDETEEPGETPINDYIIPMALVAVCLGGFKFLKSKTAKAN